MTDEKLTLSVILSSYCTCLVRHLMLDLVNLQGQVMELHDICPSQWADFCQHWDLSLQFYGWHSEDWTLLDLKLIFKHGQMTPDFMTHPLAYISATMKSQTRHTHIKRQCPILHLVSFTEPLSENNNTIIICFFSEGHVISRLASFKNHIVINFLSDNTHNS